MRTLLIPTERFVSLKSTGYIVVQLDHDALLNLKEQVIVYHDPDNAYDNVEAVVSSVYHDIESKTRSYGLSKKVNFAPRVS